MTACTECAFQNGIEHKIVFDSDTTEMMWLMHEDVRHVSPRSSILVCRVRQNWWLMHEDVSHVSPSSSILVSRVRPKWWLMQVDVNYP